MSLESILSAVIIFAIGLLPLYIQTKVKTIVEESVKHGFQSERDKIRQEFEREMSDVEWTRRIRLAALDKRLDANQKAHTLARKLIRTLRSNDKIKKTVSSECSEFWDNQCLYLSNEVRKAFISALFEYNLYDSYAIDDSETEKKESIKMMNDARVEISKLPNIIAQSINLEPVAEEDKSIRDVGSENRQNDSTN